MNVTRGAVLLIASFCSLANAGEPVYRDAAPTTGEERWTIAIAPDEKGLSDDVKRRYAGQHLVGSYQLFVKRAFEIARVEVVTSIPDCDDFVAHYFTSTRHATPDGPPVRFVQRVELVFPPAATGGASGDAAAAAGAAPRFRAVQPEFVEHAVVSAPTPYLPEAVRSRDGSLRTGLYAIYVDLDGSVPRVDTIISIAGGDETVIATLKTWRFKPQAQRVKFVRRFAFGTR